MIIFNSDSKCIPGDVELHIISFLNNQDQVILSGVNKILYKFLSNESYFKNLFKTDFAFSYLKGKPLKDRLVRLCTNHPNNCWKIACCILPIDFTNFNYEFLCEERDKETSNYEKLCEEKSKCVERLRAIGGDYYRDYKSSCSDSSSLLGQINRDRENQFESLWYYDVKISKLIKLISFKKHGKEFSDRLDSVTTINKKYKMLLDKCRQENIPTEDLNLEGLPKLLDNRKALANNLKVLASKNFELIREREELLQLETSLNSRLQTIKTWKITPPSLDELKSEVKKRLLGDPLFEHLKNMLSYSGDLYLYPDRGIEGLDKSSQSPNYLESYLENLPNDHLLRRVAIHVYIVFRRWANIAYPNDMLQAFTIFESAEKTIIQEKAAQDNLKNFDVVTPAVWLISGAVRDEVIEQFASSVAVRYKVIEHSAPNAISDSQEEFNSILDRIQCAFSGSSRNNIEQLLIKAIEEKQIEWELKCKA